MDPRLWKFSDAQLAQMSGKLVELVEMHIGKMGARFLCEMSYRLVRAGGPAMTESEESLIDELMSAEFRMRENQRKRRRLKRPLNGGVAALTTEAAQKRVASVRSIR